jgi:hypothetical protein
MSDSSINENDRFPKIILLFFAVLKLKFPEYARVVYGIKMQVVVFLEARN